MNENRKKILEMLAAGHITADEAERLMMALDKEQPAASASSSAEPAPKPKPKYLRVQVQDGVDANNKPRSVVNVRVPMQLLRSGVKLAGLIPVQAVEQANSALRKEGLNIDLNQIKPENLEELVDQLDDLTVDVDDHHSKVRVFCE